MEKGTFLLVGYRHLMKDKSVFNCYLKLDDLDNEDTLNMHILRSDEAEEFENDNDVIKLDDKVFDKLQTTRALKNENQEITQVIIELPDNLKRTVKYDYHILTKEFSFKKGEASNYIKENCKERSMTK